MPELEALDAVVVGANIRGLITAYLLSHLGYRAVVLEKGPAVGGADRSFETPEGTRFEIGLHVLDYMRSEIATRLFTHVVGGEVHRVQLERAIVLRNEIMPYAPKPSEMPESLREMLPSGELVDDLGDEAPTRERLSVCYGRAFTDFIFDEVLPSYRCENRHRAFGVDESRLLGNVYPWMFPRARRRAKTGDESRTFHDRLRAGIPQEILYPKEGGFGGFAEGFLRNLDPERIEVLTNVDDLHLEIEPGTHTVQWAGAKGRRFRARHYFWAASWTLLCAEVGISCQDTATDRVVLGSFRLNKPAITRYHELLIGDPQHQMNRVFFPGLFRAATDPLMQVEYAFPRLEDRPIDPDHWLTTWLENTRRLGILDAEHRVEEFDFKTFCMHYNAFGMEGEPLSDADPSLLREGSNLHPITPSLANLNLNGHVPRDIRTVISILAEPPPVD